MNMVDLSEDVARRAIQWWCAGATVEQVGFYADCSEVDASDILNEAATLFDAPDIESLRDFDPEAITERFMSCQTMELGLADYQPTPRQHLSADQMHLALLAANHTHTFNGQPVTKAVKAKANQICKEMRFAH